MNPLKFRNDLFASMCDRTQLCIGVRSGIVNSIQAEDGSGFNFNVTCDNGDKFFIAFNQDNTVRTRILMDVK